MARHKHHKRNLAILFLEYGVHFLIILAIVNFVVFYAVNFLTKAQTDKVEPSGFISPSPDISSFIPQEPTLTPTPEEATPIPTPVGPVIGIVFHMPGIGSGSAVMQPLHKTRPLSILLYNDDKYSYSKRVKPLYVIKTQVTYDDDVTSPTYTSFVNPYIDLGVLDDASYQVALRTNQTMPKLVETTDPLRVGGELFSFLKGVGGRNNYIPEQNMISGDIYPYPDGDSVMDINDYNALVTCFGIKANTSECKNKIAADLDDNGVIDGTDYNLLVHGYQSIMALGLPVPVLVLTPTPKPAKAHKLTLLPSLSATPAAVTKSSGGGSGIVVFLIFLLFIGGGIFVLLKTKQGRSLLEKILKKRNVSDKVEGQGETVESTISIGNQEQIASEPSVSDVPVETQDEGLTQASENETAPETSSTASAVDTSAIDNTYFVKIRTKDDKGTWVVLTDDNGPVNGFFVGQGIKDGFAKIKGVLKKDSEGKKYVDVSEWTPSE